MSRPRLGPASLACLCMVGCAANATLEGEAAVSRVSLIGDSITAQYGPLAEEMIAEQTGASVAMRFEARANAAQSPWPEWVDTMGPADVVVLQDFALLGYDVQGVSREEYVAAYQEVIDHARSQGARVYVVETPCALELDSVTGVTEWIAPPPADAEDGIHYTQESAKTFARIVCVAVTRADCDVPVELAEAR